MDPDRLYALLDSLSDEELDLLMEALDLPTPEDPESEGRQEKIDTILGHALGMEDQHMMAALEQVRAGRRAS